MLRHSESILTDEEDAEFSDALEEFIFLDASNSFDDSEPSLPVSNSSALINLDESNQDSVSVLPDAPESHSLPFSDGLRRRRQNSKKFRFENSCDSLADFNLHRSNVSDANSYKLSWNLKDNHKLDDNLTSVEEINGSSVNSNAIITMTDEPSVTNRSVTVELPSPNTGSNFLFILGRLIIKVISLQTSLLLAFVTFSIRLTHSSYIILTDPYAVMRRAKHYTIRTIFRFFNFFLGKLKSIVHKLVKKNKSTWKLCLQIGWGLLCAALIGFILVCLLVLAFVVGGALMKCIMEKPVQRIIQLNFDYTRNAPTAFVPVMSCPKSFCLDCNEKSGYGGVSTSRVILPGHKLQATVSLTLPESNYNRNLGNFQVRVDFLSSNGKFLASTTQPCTMKFKSRPIRLLMTVFNLAPLIMGYSSESQTVKIQFRGYTEHKIPTSCVRVALEPRAEFANQRGGVPEIYTAYLKLESKPPLLKRVLWSWKATVFVWTSIAVFITSGLVLMLLLCCIPRARGVPLNLNNTLTGSSIQGS